MNFKIYQNELGITVFDDYFDYIDTLNNVIDPKMYAFFSDWDRYSLSHPKTLHDAKIHSIEMKNDDLWIELSLKLGSTLQLIYSKPQFIITNNCIGNDLLVHELSYLEEQNRYIHALCFDGNQNLLIYFNQFDFIEK